MRRRSRTAFCLALLACLWPAGVEAVQVARVYSYDVTIDVEEDGWLEVTEEIRLQVSPEAIEGRVPEGWAHAIGLGGPVKREVSQSERASGGWVHGTEPAERPLGPEARGLIAV